MSQQKQILIIDNLLTPKQDFEKSVRKSNLDYEIIWDEKLAAPDRVEVIVTVLKKLGKEYLQQFSNLKLIAVAFTGYDSVDIEYCSKHNIAVYNVPKYSTNSVVELTIGLTIAVLREITYGNKIIRNEGWGFKPGIELSGKTIGIMGTGEIGVATANIFKAFGCELIGWSRSENDAFKALGGEYISDKQKFFATADIVSVHLPLNKDTDELRSDGSGGCEDARITYFEPLKRYIMTYTALSPKGPRIALAISQDLFNWKRLGLASFESFIGIDFANVDNKDAILYPVSIPNHNGKLQMAILHRPLFQGTRPEEVVYQSKSRVVDIEHESIWISYCPVPENKSDIDCLGVFNSHHRLASPVSPWERLKIGGGTPPILTRFGWLILYHGVNIVEKLENEKNKLCYSAGIMILSKDHPQHIHYRSLDPVLTPQSKHERIGTISNVVFPTGIDQRLDLDMPNRFDIYYGMADSRIGVARLDLPEVLNKEGIADAPDEKV